MSSEDRTRARAPSASYCSTEGVAPLHTAPPVLVHCATSASTLRHQCRYKSGRASSYCFGSSWHLLDLTDVLLLEDVVLSSCSDWLLLAASLLWADSLPHCTGSFVPAYHAETSQILTPACQDCIYFRQTLAVSISAHRRPIKNW